MFGAVCLLVVMLTWLADHTGGQVLLRGPEALQAAENFVPSGSGRVVRVDFGSAAQAAQLTARLDVWEVHRDQGYLIAYVDSSEQNWLMSHGFTVEAHPLMDFHPATIPNFSCFRTVDELYAQLNAWVAGYPTLAELRAVGHSYEHRPLYVMRLTNKNIAGEKPVFFLMANIHGRELVTPETAMSFIQQLLQGYGSDPDITWLLDHHEAHVLVSANPDGHVRNEPGQPWTFWRKNAHPYGINICGSQGIGVDLNRNSSFKWGYDNTGSSPAACDEVYRGPAAMSEPETQDVQNYIRSVFTDQRGPGDSDAAPSNTSGILITLHSYGNVVLWPWGWTATAAPNSAQLAMLGQKMARYTGYTPAQANSNTMYPTNGSTDDWAYGELGVPAFTFEEGGDGGFYPTCSLVPGIVTPNIAALTYAFKVARTPYSISFGPDVTNVTGGSATIESGEPVLIEATIDDSSGNASHISAAEAYIDVPPWAGGQPVDLTPVDGGFDSVVENVHAGLPTASLAAGRHLVYVRGRNAQGFWGPFSAGWISLTAAPSSTLLFLPVQHASRP